MDFNKTPTLQSAGEVEDVLVISDGNDESNWYHDDALVRKHNGGTAAKETTDPVFYQGTAIVNLDLSWEGAVAFDDEGNEITPASAKLDLAQGRAMLAQSRAENNGIVDEDTRKEYRDLLKKLSRVTLSYSVNVFRGREVWLPRRGERVNITVVENRRPLMPENKLIFDENGEIVEEVTYQVTKLEAQPVGKATLGSVRTIPRSEKSGQPLTKDRGGKQPEGKTADSTAETKTA
jgi:hypothetical protein